MTDHRLSHKNCLTTDISNFIEYHDDANNRIGIQCTVCSFEWLSTPYGVPDLGDADTLIVDGIKFHSFTKRMYCDPDYRVNKDNVELKCFKILDQKLQIGDHICYKPKTWKKLFIIHHAIIEDLRSEDGRIKVDLIHWKMADEQNRREILRERNVDLSILTDCVVRCEYPKEYMGSDNSTLTLARAKALIGKYGYDLLKENCEHFATFCKIGTFHSWQVWYAVRKIVTTTIGALTGVLKASTGALIKAGKVAAVSATKHGSSAVSGAVADISGDVIEVAVKGGEHFLTMSTQAIGFGIVVVVQGVSFTINVGQLYKAKRNGELSGMQFQSELWKAFITLLEGIFFTGGIPLAGALILGMFNPGTAVAVGGLLIGPILGGVLASYARGFGHTFMGRTMSYCTKPIMQYSSIRIHSVIQLLPGDHLVIPQWFLHPRCHVIVVEVVSEENAMEVIRFTFDRGVVKEKIKFVTPAYKVIYKNEDTFDSGTVIERASRKIGSKQLVYRILQNNCKSFARWCKTGQLPSSIISIEGYNDITDSNQYKLKTGIFSFAENRKRSWKSANIGVQSGKRKKIKD